MKKFLDSHFKLKNLGDLKYFLGFEVARSNKGITLNQRHYALQFLWMQVFLVAKQEKLQWIQVRCSHRMMVNCLMTLPLNRRLIEKLLHLTITRPDSPHLVGRLSQFLAQPRVPYVQVVCHVLQYIKATFG